MEKRSHPEAKSEAKVGKVVKISEKWQKWTDFNRKSMKMSLEDFSLIRA